MSQGIKIGRWVLAIARHLDVFKNTPEKMYFERTIFTAKCGLLLARMRRLERIEWNRLKAMAQDMGIFEMELKRMILPHLEEANLIEISRDSTGDIKEVFEYVSSAEESLEDMTRLWLNSNPTDVERVVVESLEICSLRPHSLSEYQETLIKQGFSEETINLARELQKSFRLIQEVSVQGIKEPYLYNEYLWGNRIHEAVRFFDHLPPEIKDYVAELMEQVRNKQGYPIRLLKDIPKEVINDAEQVGLIDTTKIVTQDGRQELFAFTPHFFGVGLEKTALDLFNEVKLFVASIMYGHRFATYRIKDPIILVEALLRDKEVGPASPIGRDYPLIETAGIVKVEKSKFHSDRYYMRLIKEDVVKQGLAVLKKGFVEQLGRYNLDSTGLYLPGDFQGPEEYRTQLAATLAEPSRASLMAREQVIRAMRGEDFW